MMVLVLVQTVLLAVLIVLVAGLLRAHGTVLRRLHQLDGGAVIDEGTPAFALRRTDVPDRSAVVDPTAYDVSGETPEGEVVTVRLVDVEHRTLVVFLSSGCDTCQPFWDDLTTRLPLPHRTRLLVVAQGRDAESPPALTRLAAPGVDVVLSSDAWRDYQVPGSPYAVLVDGRSGRVRGEGTGQSLRQVLQLLVRTTDDSRPDDSRPDDSRPVAEGLRDGSNRDAQQEAAADRALLAAGILPGDPRLYGEDA